MIFMINDNENNSNYNKGDSYDNEDDSNDKW